MKFKGFTLIEALLYVAISSLLMMTALTFFSHVVMLINRIETSRSALADAEFIFQKLDNEIRNSSSIYSFNSTDVCLGNSYSGWFRAMRIHQVGNEIRLARGFGLWGCQIMVYDEPISSDLVKVSSLSFANVSPPGSGSDSIKMDIQFVGPAWLDNGNLPGGNENYLFSNTITIRSW